MRSWLEIIFFCGAVTVFTWLLYKSVPPVEWQAFIQVLIAVGGGSLMGVGISMWRAGR